MWNISFKSALSGKYILNITAIGFSNDNIHTNIYTSNHKQELKNNGHNSLLLVSGKIFERPSYNQVCLSMFFQEQFNIA